jgi:hypothetical protein
VGVNTEKQVLQHDRPGPLSSLECEQPGTSRLVASSKHAQRVEVSVGEDHIESLHPSTVLEQPARNALTHPFCDALIKGREVTNAAPLRCGPLEDLVQTFDHLIDRVDVLAIAHDLNLSHFRFSGLMPWTIWSYHRASHQLCAYTKCSLCRSDARISRDLSARTMCDGFPTVVEECLDPLLGLRTSPSCGLNAALFSRFSRVEDLPLIAPGCAR